MNQNKTQAVEAPAISSKKHYEAPCIIESSEMTFTESVWEDFSQGAWCFGCTNCNCN
ncbi:MAG: hypothetical protein LBD13_07750 [Spirochaetaceae bacterium]|jgi:hypothetical protein|nr:hypothetical protein [Spirochaetaceae bacterium]